MELRKKKALEGPLKEESKKESKPKDLLDFESFYAMRQSTMDFNLACHPDWYMLGACSGQYPLSDNSLESPKEAYDKYLKLEEK